MANENGTTFRCNDMYKRGYSFFKDMKNKKELCDVSFQIGNESISAHRVILCASIPYFREMLSNKCLQGGKEGITIPDIEPCAFKCLIEFAYTCEVNINKKNARDLLAAACCLGVDEVREACCDFLDSILEPENVVSIRKLAIELNCTELNNSVSSYVTENFRELYQGKDFVKYPLTFLEEILHRDDLLVNEEEQVFEAILKWVKASPEDRRPALPELMCMVRMPLLKHQVLAEIAAREELIRTSVLCRDLLDEARNYNFFPSMRKNPCSFQINPRKSKKTVSNDNCTGSIYKLEAVLRYTVQSLASNRSIKRWNTKPNLEFIAGGCSAAAVCNKMYFFDWGETLQYDEPANDYKFLSNVPTPRSRTTAATLESMIYVCGGKVGDIAFNVVERFNPIKDEWTDAHPMPTARWAASAVALGKYLYVLGGRDNSSVYDCVERYDPVIDKWEKMTSMFTKRYSFGSAVRNGQIYVCGGKRVRGDVTSTAEVYDPIKNNWKFISPMESARYCFMLLSSGEKLYALNGHNYEGKRMHSFDVYDPETDEWSYGSSTDKNCYGIAAVVM